MSTHGSMTALIRDWPTYVERLQHYFVAIGVTDYGQKALILFTLCCTYTYKLLCSLSLNDKLEGVPSATRLACYKVITTKSRL